ncbi:DUF418 domain-containing protein [Psychrobacillus sp. Sa2BUA9]|uniref:DUF418 domain-containing protein n=1 Tax=Psychrobacillus faecigallinarum TaxID=2762235 RepID=A0ABR8R6W0_9BACI|nr:DUF418 domain-containing protein [Psychrobacillus faecigallinarum]MBD7943519.1 DUF418 domain-containing protein [Psychrobacillus faecigallinarum]
MTSERLRLIDILRGFAVLGTLGTNIWIFAYLGDLSYITTANFTEWWVLEDFLRMVVLFIVNGKLLGLLTIMFGVGLEMKYQQAIRKGNAWPGVYIWTLLFLLLEGFIHFTLVMEYDILMSYAVTGLIVALVLKRGDTFIKKIMIGVGSFHAIIVLLILVGALVGVVNMSLGSYEGAALYESGTWLKQVENRLFNFVYYRLEAILIVPMNICLFLLGVFLMRSGVFSKTEKGKSQRKKLFQIGMYIGVPLNLLIFIPGGAFDLPVRYLFAPIMSLGYIGLFGILIEYRKFEWLWSRFEEVGKMSLSCYVSQNLLASIVFYGWGLGLGGKLGSLSIITIWLSITLFQFLFAYFCIRKLHTGPLEWMRRKAVAIVSK